MLNVWLKSNVLCTILIFFVYLPAPNGDDMNCYYYSIKTALNVWRFLIETTRSPFFFWLVFLFSYPKFSFFYLNRRYNYRFFSFFLVVIVLIVVACRWMALNKSVNWIILVNSNIKSTIIIALYISVLESLCPFPFGGGGGGNEIIISFNLSYTPLNTFVLLGHSFWQVFDG